MKVKRLGIHVAVIIFFMFISISIIMIFQQYLNHTLDQLARKNATLYQEVLVDSTNITSKTFEKQAETLIEIYGKDATAHGDEVRFITHLEKVTTDGRAHLRQSDDTSIILEKQQWSTLQNLKRSIIHVTLHDQEQGFYLYYIKEGLDEYVAFFSSNMLFSTQAFQYKLNQLLIDKTGKVLSHNLESNPGLLYSFLLEENDEETVNQIKLFTNHVGPTDASFTEKIMFQNAESMLYMQQFEDVFLVTLIDYRSIVDTQAHLKTFWLASIISTLFIFLVVSILISSIFNKTNLEAIIDIKKQKSRIFVLTLNKGGVVLRKNKYFTSFVKEQKQYKNIFDFRMTEHLYASQEQKLDLLESSRSFIVELQSQDGAISFVNFLSISVNKNRFQLIGEDVTVRFLNRLSIEKVALEHSVTGLPNANVYRTDVETALANSKRSKNSLLLLNVVGFTKQNKIFGMSGGDEILRALAKKVLTITKDKVSLYHLMADEFLIISRDQDHYQDAENLAKKILNMMKTPFEVNQNTLLLKLKIAIMHLEIEKYDILNSVVCRNILDIALKKARVSYHQDYIVYDQSLQQSNVKEVSIIHALSKALEQKEFEMYYQPQFNNRIQEIVGFEALIRWNNPEYKGISAQEFIQLAEKHNLINEIGRFVIEETFQIAQKFSQHNISISINVSPIQMMQAGFASELIGKFREYGLKPGAIAIEVTETFLVESMETVVEKLKLLRQVGFHIHLDDFGTGYSSLLYLKDLPIDMIKIDREFIKNLTTDTYSQAIVSKVISMADILGLKVICEGVESEECNKMLKKMGCEIIQGFLIGRGIPLSQAYAHVLEQEKKRMQTVKEEKKKLKKGSVA